MRVELHCHSHYSKGTKLPIEAIPSPREIMHEAKRRGLDAVALTDHNHVGGWAEARREAKRQGLVFIPGCEISTREGHILGIGLTDQVPRDRGVEETVDLIHDQGGLAIAPHPFDIKGDGVREAFRHADAAEVFNAMNFDRFSNWVMRRKIGSLPGTVGSDAHTLAMIGNCVNLIPGTTMDDVLAGIKKNRVRHHVAYNSMQDVKEWAYTRFTLSEAVVRKRIAQYPGPKRWISERMLNKFLQNQDGFFTALGHFGVFCSYWYGAGKALTAV